MVAQRPDRRLERLLPVLRWPSAAQARSSRWMQPLRIGPIEARDRTWVPAMVPWRADEDGFVTPNVIAWYRRFARGRPGVLVVEATGIRDVPSGPLLRAGHERFVPGLRALADAVREASGGHTRLFLQILDFLAIKRRVSPERFAQRFLRVDAALCARVAAHFDAPEAAHDEARTRALLAEADDDAHAALLDARTLEELRMGYRERVTDTQLPHIAELPQTLPPLFAAAAERARDAGFDGVELHYAHAYTMSSFLSALNTRDDGYGGDRDARARLPLEVYDAVRRRVGRDWVVGCRMLGDDVVEGGSRLDDAVDFALRFARGGMDFLSISKGGRFEDAKQPKIGAAAYPYTGPSGHECMPTVHIDERGPWSRNVPLAAQIRRGLRAEGLETPVVTAGGVATFEQAEEILAAGQADAVASARQSLADPDWFEKLRQGRGEEIRRCLFTNYCEALDQNHKEVTCQRWDREPAREGEELAMSADGKRRLIPPPWS